MTVFQLMMLFASAYFMFKIYEHIQTLEEPNEKEQNNSQEEKTAKTFSPFSPEALIQKADVAFNDGDMKKSYALLIEANAKDNNNAEILFKLGFIAKELNELDEAVEFLKQSLEIDNKDEFVHNTIASVYRLQGKFDIAKNHLEHSIEIDSSNFTTYYNYANLLVDMGDTDKAIEMYKKSLELNPELEEAKIELTKLKGEI